MIIAFKQSTLPIQAIRDLVGIKREFSTAEEKKPKYKDLISRPPNACLRDDLVKLPSDYSIAYFPALQYW